MASHGKSWYGTPHSFANIPDAKIQRSTFDRSCGHKTTLDAGYLVPIFVEEALPGDTFNLRAHLFGRLSTPLHPIMDNMFVETQFFAVPLRLIWTNFRKFMGEQDDPGDSTSYTVPVTTAPASTGYAVGSLQDYLGIPSGTPDLVHSALFTRAASLIYNEWYRDENIIDSVVVDKDDGPDDPTDYVLQRRGKRKDYFTSSLPWPAKESSVSLPLGTTAPVIGDSTTDEKPTWVIDGGSTVIGLRGTTADNNASWTLTPDATSTAVWDDPKLVADLANATGATINQLRQSMQLQRLYERDARGGTRYTEIIRSHFGVTSPDQRLQRPEYLGGGSQNLSFVPVAQTIDNGTSPQGNLAAYATSIGSGHSFVHSFTEHCIVLGFVSIRADYTYQYGLNRMWSRSTREDFYWPALAHIGEQAVLSKEIYADASAGDDNVWGYQERYAEYRYKPSQLSGKFVSWTSGSLDLWHLAQEHVARPTLNQAFIEEDPPVDRVIAVPSEPHLILDCWFDFKASRPMPTYGVPGMMDHF